MAYQAPGVYVEETSSPIKPISGVGTSTAGFIGVVPDNVDMPDLPPQQVAGSTKKYKVAPENAEQLVTSWDEFTRAFGDVQTGNQALAHAVRGFFANGGSRCFVVRAKVAPTTDTLPLALAALGGRDEVALVAMPGITDGALQKLVVDHCAALRNRFAILDGDPTAKQLTAAEITKSGSSSYAAVYFPWIDVGAKNTDGTIAYQAPSGHVAGVYARVDGERGVHKAPANEVVRGAFGVQVGISRPQQEGLNPAGVNCIRIMNGNVTIWGARTTAAASEQEWRYVSVRRLFIFLRESIEQGTGWMVFEPNGPDLWSKIRRNVTAFLTNVWQSGALFGTTAEQAFYVRCDETLNDENTREQGTVITEIGLAVTRPAEFVVFRVTQWAGPGQ